ncbi:MAG TPA: 2,3,4,5-tetrahydropyridine-2,6-dicarboxylate N-acetyltransferase [Bacillota bacterium]|nr:2,3,4,5-tetrahydropyridine-2,6-dicarboxylate N-acetyltransferase [Bacillota bacterium]
MNTEEILNLLKNSSKKTPVKVYLQGKINQIPFSENCIVLKAENGGIIIGDWEELKDTIHSHPFLIEKLFIESDRRNSTIGLLELFHQDARIEPGAIIREGVTLEKNTVIMMGAIINIGATIGEETLIDMNAVIGGRANIGKKCHVGAGVVIKGVISSPHAQPVQIEDEVIIGPNAVIMEGIHIGRGAVIVAGSIVTRNVVAGEIFSS